MGIDSNAQIDPKSEVFRRVHIIYAQTSVVSAFLRFVGGVSAYIAFRPWVFAILVKTPWFSVKITLKAAARKMAAKVPCV